MHKAMARRASKLKKIALILTVAIVSLFAGQIFAQPAGPRMGMGPGRGPMHRGDGPMCYGNWEEMKEILKLSDKQIEEIGRINNEFNVILKRLQEKMAPLQVKLKSMLLGDVGNTGELRVILRKISDIEVEMRMSRIQQRFAIEKILTKEQRERLRNERRSMMRDWR
jgi:Spy/CpxP family protein refolding chaperone